MCSRPAAEAIEARDGAAGTHGASAGAWCAAAASVCGKETKQVGNVDAVGAVVDNVLRAKTR